MTPMRWFYAAFWLLIGTMLFLQFQSYNKHLDRAVAAGPKQQHFFFINGATNALSTTDAPPRPDGADVKQVGFSTVDNTPAPGSFTCYIVLKNYGNRKATGIQAQVAPYRWTMQENDNDNDSRTPTRAIPTSNPPQVDQWVSVPDLAPGETKTVEAIFATQPGFTPGDNANPQITFHSQSP